MRRFENLERLQVWIWHRLGGNPTKELVIGMARLLRRLEHLERAGEAFVMVDEPTESDWASYVEYLSRSEN